MTEKKVKYPHYVGFRISDAINTKLVQVCETLDLEKSDLLRQILEEYFHV